MTKTISKKMPFGKAFAIIMIGILALAFSAIMVKEANFEPSTSAWLRCAIAFIVLIPFAYNERKKKGKLSKTGFWLAILAGIFLGIDMVAWNHAIFYVGAGISSVLLNLQIIILPGLAMFFDKYKPKPIFWALVPIMIVGIVLTGGIFDAQPSDGPTLVYGLPIAITGTLLGSLSGICYGIYLYTSRKSGTVNPGKYIQPLMWVFIAQLIPQTLSMIFFSDRGFDITNGVLINGQLPDVDAIVMGSPVFGDAITMTNWLWIIALAVIGHALAWVFVQVGSVNMEPTVVAGLLLLSPVTTVVVATWTHNEIPSTLQIIGVVLVLLAVAVQNELHLLLFKGKKKKPDTSTS